MTNFIGSGRRRVQQQFARAGTALLGALVLLFGAFSGEAAAQSCSPTTAGAISGIAFLDANGDLTRQATEQGINGVVLQIAGPTGSTLTVTSGGVSSIPGSYSSGILCDEGTYVVQIVSVPTGYVVTGPSLQSVTLTRDPSSGVLNKKGNLNFALGLAPCTSSIGDYVWNDLNANGIQEAGEPPLSGVVVTLRSLAGAVLQVTTTDGSGNYTFVVPCSQTYVVEVVTPAGFTPTVSLQGGNVNADSDGSPTQVTVGANDHRTDVDFGFYALCQGVIGDFVWHDLDRDGVQDAGEPGLYNVKIELLQNGVVVRTTYTDASGHYQFDGICPGTYQVRYDAATLPTGFEPTQSGQGDAGTDSNTSPVTVTLPDYNSSDVTIDFGFQVPCAGVIGDFVWDDRNANGVQDADEPGLANVEVRLYREGQSSPVQVVVTSANGSYLFTGLCGGDYVVEVNPSTLPAGSPWYGSPANQGVDDERDSDGIEHRASGSVPTDTGSNLTIDFGYFRKQPLTATKTAAGSYDRRIAWTLAKTVDPTSHSGTAGQTAGTSVWSVTATMSETLGSYRVTGNIVVSNPNAFDVAFAVVDQLNDGTVAAVSCPVASVPASSSVTCSYSAAPTGGTATLNTATVTSALGEVSANAPVAFTANVIGDDSVTLADSRFNYSQQIAGSTTQNFSETFTCPADSSLYINGRYTFTVTNTATLRGANTDLSDDATVTVTCTKQYSSGTATGYGYRYPGTSNWFMYTPYTTAKVDLVSGRDLQDAGDILMRREGSGASAVTIITITLHAGWTLASVRDVVKIQPFNSAPSTYVQPGAFVYKFTPPNTASYPGTSVVFSGNTVTVTMPGHTPRFYGIHLDVLHELP